ncbi:hypothetical protein DPMN_116029 [Dreissena polymorpha]|uniref:Uncharacterized protein n=1 Tax=Dreissena polymorpha TaxID=45954 RepID=A0A9D4KNL6_DREPO|nr:hypothetical protein DPMN_116029 [Dreissena polymorpha]
MIGQCRGLNVFECSVKHPFSGHYKMTSNNDITRVTLTIAAFNETHAGEYCCSKESMKESTCQCIKVAGLNKRAMILSTTAVLFYSTF